MHSHSAIENRILYFLCRQEDVLASLKESQGIHLAGIDSASMCAYRAEVEKDLIVQFEQLQVVLDALFVQLGDKRGSDLIAAAVRRLEASMLEVKNNQSNILKAAKRQQQALASKRSLLKLPLRHRAVFSEAVSAGMVDICG